MHSAFHKSDSQTRAQPRRYTPCMENTLVGGLPLSRFLVSVSLSEPVRSTLSIKSSHECAYGRRRALRERRQGPSNIGEPRLPLSMIIISFYSTGIITNVYRRAFERITLKPDRAKLTRFKHNRYYCRAKNARGRFATRTQASSVKPLRIELCHQLAIYKHKSTYRNAISDEEGCKC